MRMAVVSTLFFLPELTFIVCCSVGLAKYRNACYLHGNMPPIAATSTQQCPGWPVRQRKLLPARRLDGAECTVSLVIPIIVDGLLSCCCESDGLLGCWCRVSLLGVAAWRQNPVFLPYPAGRHGDQAGRDCGVGGDSYSRKRI